MSCFAQKSQKIAKKSWEILSLNFQSWKKVEPKILEFSAL